MRIILVAAAIAALAVSGCDINTGPPKTAKVECNCAAPAPEGLRPSTAYAPPAMHDRYRGYAHHSGYGTARGGGHSHYWRREYSEVSVATYDYHSDSHSYVMGGGDSSGVSAYAYAAAGGYGGGGAYAGGSEHGGGGYHVVDHGWVDGYGRGHDGGGATTGTPVHFETHSGGHGRGAVWHGYDVDCPDKPTHR